MSAQVPTEGPAWSREDLQESPHEHAEKATRVQSMFTEIAPAYDLNNTLHSFGRDRAWRRRAVRLARVRPGEEVLDVACGTGALSEAFSRSGAARVVGVDYTEGMLEVAREKARRLPEHNRPEYDFADAMDLPFAARSFDVVTIAFGIRNVAEPDRALHEFARVLRPGGRLIILEFAEPSNRILRMGNAFYTRRVMPFTASLIARDRSGAYKYLPRSIQTFLEPAALKARINATGLRVREQVPMTFGVCVATLAVREPAHEPATSD